MAPANRMLGLGSNLRRKFIARGIVCALCSKLGNEVARWELELTDRHLALEVGCCSRHSDQEVAVFFRQMLGIDGGT